MNAIDQFAKISPIVNELGEILIIEGNEYKVNSEKIKLKDREIGICISFKHKKINEKFITDGKITLDSDNKKYMVRSLITMINEEPIKLAGNVDSAAIDQFPGLDIDIYDIDIDAFEFKKTKDGASYKIVGFSSDENGNLKIPKLVNGKIIVFPYEYKSLDDEEALPVTIIDAEQYDDERNKFYPLKNTGAYYELVIPYSIDMIKDKSFPVFDNNGSGCKLILTKHVLIF